MSTMGMFTIPCKPKRQLFRGTKRFTDKAGRVLLVEQETSKRWTAWWSDDHSIEHEGTSMRNAMYEAGFQA